MRMNLETRTIYAYGLFIGCVLLNGYTITQLEVRGKMIHTVGQSDDGKSVKSHSFGYYDEVTVFKA